MGTLHLTISDTEGQIQDHSYFEGLTRNIMSHVRPYVTIKR